MNGLPADETFSSSWGSEWLVALAQFADGSLVLPRHHLTTYDTAVNIPSCELAEITLSELAELTNYNFGRELHVSHCQLFASHGLQ